MACVNAAEGERNAGRKWQQAMGVEQTEIDALPRCYLDLLGRSPASHRPV